MALWPTQAKVEDIVLKAAWHWDGASNVKNDTLGEPNCTHCRPSIRVGLHGW